MRRLQLRARLISDGGDDDDSECVRSPPSSFIYFKQGLTRSGLIFHLETKSEWLAGCAVFNTDNVCGQDD